MARNKIKQIFSRRHTFASARAYNRQYNSVDTWFDWFKLKFYAFFL